MECPRCGYDMDEDRPKCFVRDCPNEPMYETWARNHDFAGIPTGMITKVLVCEEHTNHPYLCKNSNK